MSKLTEPRFRKIKPILDRYADELARTHCLDMRFEREVRDVLNIGYQELKGIIIDLAKKSEYTPLAARYMESGEPAVVSEFWNPLARLYGIRHYHAEDREAKQREFWESAFQATAVP